MTYKDQLRICPTGIQAVINEFISHGLTDYIQYDEDIKPIGLRVGNGFDWTFSPSLPDYNTECAVLMRINEKVMADIGAIKFDNAILLIDSEKDQIWKELEADTGKRATYEAIYPPHKNYLDEDGIETDINTGIVNPLAGQINRIGNWAS